MRSFHHLLLGVASAALVAAVPAQAQITGKGDKGPSRPAVKGGMVLKGQSTHPASSNLHLVFVKWAEEIEKMSAGRVKIDTLPAGAVVPAFETFDAASRGVIDVGAGTLGYILGKSLAGIPLSHGPVFGMDGIDYYGWYLDGGGMKLLEEYYTSIVKLNLVGFPVPTDYPQGLGWFKKPIRSLADLKGMKYRIFGIGAETYGRLGVSVVTLPGGEIVPALERGVIEGAEWINCAEDKKLGLNNVAKHYYTPGMHEPVTGGQLFVNTSVWKKLSPDIQEIFRVASISAVTQRNMILARETAEACQELIKGGTQMHRTPDDILKNFLDEWEKIQAEYAKKDPFYKKVIDSQKKYAELIVPFRMSWYPPYDFAGKYYWKDKIYLQSGKAQ